MAMTESGIGKRRAASWRRRGDATLRLLAAMPLGYAVASLWAMALARMLPMPAAPAATTATLIAFVICAGAAMWAYAASTGWRAVWTLAAAGLVAATFAWLSISSGGRL
jgi:type IV secretory pathway VirB2 component (pilin)